MRRVDQRLNDSVHTLIAAGHPSRLPQISDFSTDEKRKYAHLSITKTKNKTLEYGPMPNVMAALPNIGGALCSTPQCLTDANY